MKVWVFVFFVGLALAQETKTAENIPPQQFSQSKPINNIPSDSEYTQPIPLMIDFALLIEDYLYSAYTFIRHKEPYNIITFYIILIYLLWKLLHNSKTTSYITHSTKILDPKTQETVLKALEARNSEIEKELLVLKSSIKPPAIPSDIESSVNLLPGINKILDELKEIENTHKEFEEEINDSHKEILEELHYLSLETLKPPEPESAGPDSAMPSDDEEYSD